MASSQNRIMSQTVASKSKTQTPSKQLTPSVSTVQFKNSIGMGLAAQQNSPNFVAGKQSAPGSALGIRNDSALAQPNSGSIKSTTMSHSSVNLRGNMFQKHTANSGYQPSYLRENKTQTYVSQSPNKHKSRNSLATTLIKQSKVSHGFTASKQRTADKAHSALKSSESKQSIARIADKGRDTKFRSGSQFAVTLQSANSTSRAPQTAATRTRNDDQEYTGGLSSNQSATRLPVENSFTRLHQGNSSVVRTYERKLQQQSSTSQGRNPQSDQTRFQLNKNRNSNAFGNRASQNQLFNTRDRQSQNYNLQISTHYSSNQGSGLANQIDSARSNGQANGDRKQDNNNGTNGTRNKSHKQPRQSKSSINNQGSSQTAGTQLPASTDNTQSVPVLPPASSSTLTITASRSATGLVEGPLSNQTSLIQNHQSVENLHPQPNAASGLESSLSFTRRLIEETTARNDRQTNEEIKALEKDISQISVQIQSQHPPVIETQAQKFISPKNKPTISTAFGSSVHKPLISPINMRGPTSIVDKKHSLNKGISSSATKPPISFGKAAYGGPGPHSVFSPDKRPNFSRSQVNNNLYYKRGGKTTTDTKRDTSKGNHQRMFAPQNFSAAAGNPGLSASPNKGSLTGPGYLQSTFCRQTKTKNADKSTPYSYQLNRIRPTKQQQQQKQPTQEATNSTPIGSQASSKQLEPVKILDQASPRSTANAANKSAIPLSSTIRQSVSKQGTASTKKKQYAPWNSSTVSNKNNLHHRTPKQQTMTRAQRPASKRGLTEHSVGAQQPIRTYQKASKALQEKAKQTKLARTAVNQTPEIATMATQIDQTSSTLLIAQNEKLLALTQPKAEEQVQPLVEEVGPDQVTSDSYKRKQDQIIEMIQSNMKRSEDIQQSLLFASNQKSRQSSRSNASHNLVDQAKVNDLHHKEYQSETVAKSLHESPQLSQEPKTLVEQKSLAEPEAQVPLVSAKQPSPGKKQERAISVSPVGQEESLQVEDVFNDQQLVNNRMAQESSTNIIKDVTEVKPAQQPEDIVKPIAVNNLCHSDSFGPASPVDLQNLKQELPETKKPQSQFAKALALKAQIASEQEQKKEVDEDALTPKKADENPFAFSAEVADEKSSDDTPMKPIDLEVVAEDLREDRYSLASSIQQRESNVGKTSLPMSKDAFVKKFSSILTGQEKQELMDLEIANDTVYYASDIPTRTSVEAAVTNSDDEDGYYIIKPKDHILYRFEILKVLGKGSFAQVVSAIDHLTGQRVAVKINRNTEIDHKFAKQEANLLKFLMEEDPNDDNNIVRLIEHITFREHQCFIFELLNTDLFEHLKENEFMGFSESQIKSYAAQLLKALVFLEKRKVIHCDMKPENILCVDPARKHLKVVDFGSGCLTHEQVYTYVQSRYYRAPEVILRIPYSERVDIWSLGCILAELYTGEPLFPGNNEQEQLEYIMELCGMFPESMIDKSRKKDHYFDTDYSPFLIEDPKHGIMRIPENRSIEEAIPSTDELFLDFVKQCLILDPDVRPGAAQASLHPWIKDCFAQDGVVEKEIHQPMPVDYIPLRAKKNPSQTQSITQSFTNSHVGEELDLGGNMRASMEGNGFVIGNDEEYFEGQVTESGRASTEVDLQRLQTDENLNSSERETIIKMSQPSMSRQREEAGARETPAEISPDRPMGSFLTEKQRMTSFTGVMPPEILGRKTDAGLIKPQILKVTNSPSKLLMSPLKPSNESLLEHYKYEKQQNSKGSADKSHSISDLYARSSEPILKTSQSNAAQVDEPKIISVSTSSFNQQQPL